MTSWHCSDYLSPLLKQGRSRTRCTPRHSIRNRTSKATYRLLPVKRPRRTKEAMRRQLSSARRPLSTRTVAEILIFTPTSAFLRRLRSSPTASATPPSAFPNRQPTSPSAPAPSHTPPSPTHLWRSRHSIAMSECPALRAASSSTVGVCVEFLSVCNKFSIKFLTYLCPEIVTFHVT